jgi:CSLREA domain-containing protein
MRNLVRLCCALAVASLIIAASSPAAFRSSARARAAAAAPITVNSTSDAASDDGLCTLREAITSANSNAASGASAGECAAGAGDDTITFSVTGTINLTGALPDINSNMTISGPSAQLTVRRDTGGDYRIFTVSVGSTVGISGLTVTNGRTPDGTPANFAGNGGDGGGVANFGTLTLTGVTVTANATGAGGAGISFGGRGGNGGGVFNSTSSTLTLTDCIVSGNSAGAGGVGNNGGGDGGSGGGVFNQGTLTMTNCAVSGNSTGRGGDCPNFAGRGGDGGGVLSMINTAALNGVTITDNTSGDSGTGNGGFGGMGGGFMVRGASSMTLTNSTVSGNKSGNSPMGTNGFGGGAMVNGTLFVSGSTFSGNTTGGPGGGLMNQGVGTLKMVNSTVSGNLGGNGIQDDSSTTLWLTNCTVTGNTTYGVLSFSGRAVIRNTIIAGNGGGSGPDVSGGYSSQGHNLIGNADGSSGFNVTGDQVGSTGSPLNPRLGSLADNGGPTKTHALLAGSPALDAGDNALAKDVADNTLTTDQRGAGFPRFADSSDTDTTQTVDIGAFEAHPTVEDIADKTVFEDGAIEFDFNIGDAVAGISSVTATSSDAALVPNDSGHISLAGAGSQRTLHIIPAAGVNGTATITVTVTATNGRTATDTFLLTIVENDPVFSAVSGSGVYAGTATLTATLTLGGNPVAGKFVDFALNDNLAGSAMTNASGVATLTGVSLSGINAGTYSNAVRAAIAGDANLSSTSGTGPLNVARADTTTTVTVSNAAFDGNPHGATAVVTGPGGLNQSLTVTYTGDGPYGPTTTPPTFVGGYTASASYAGDSNYNASSDSKNYSITKASQTITFNALADKTYGDADFNVSATASSGLTVSFGVSGNCTLAGTTVHITGAGSCTVTASQAGDANYDAAPDVARSFNIAKAETATAVSSSANPSTSGQSVTFTATVTSAAGAPTGTVQFKVDGTNLGSPVALNASGTASVSDSTIPLGMHTVTAVYGGDANFNTSTGTLSGSQAVVPTVSMLDTFKPETDEPNETTLGVQLSAAVNFPVTVKYATSDGTATSPSDYQAATGTVIFQPGESFKLINVTVNGDTTYEDTETFFVDLSSPVNAVIDDGRGQALIINDDPAGGVIEFDQSSYTVAEAGSLTVTVKRSLHTEQAVDVDYTTDDGSDPDVVVPCSSTTGLALDRCDYTKALGTLHFAPGETEKTFKVLINDDSFTEGPETARLKLLNPSSNAALGPKSTADFTITDDSQETTTNPLDDDIKFVTQHYRDFLNREPDAPGLAFWVAQIASCGQDAQCREVKRINVSAAFFFAIEFQETGYLVERTYKTAYGDATSPGVAGTVPVIRLDEFLADTQRTGQGLIVGQGAWQEQLEANKVAYFTFFVSRARFVSAYPTTMTPAQFVDALFANAGVTPTAAERQAAIDEFANASDTSSQAARGRALRRVAENPTLNQHEFNRAFVLMQYYGYLRRNPNDAPEPTLNYGGWKFWLTKLEEFNGNFVKAEMVKAFLSSDEYRYRFGQ